MDNFKKQIEDIVLNIYKDKTYPNQNDLIVSRNDVHRVVQQLQSICLTNIELLNCQDCQYCFQIAASISLEIPIIPNYSYDNKSKLRKKWIKDYGSDIYQMYIAISRLSKVAMLYWSKYKYSYFTGERSHNVLHPPNENWQKLISIIKDVLNKDNIIIIPENILIRRYNVTYKGVIEGIDRKPNLIKLLFSEELH